MKFKTIKQQHGDMGGVRACTRLAPRSYAKVGAVFTKLVVDAALSGNWCGMKSLYNRACGTVAPERKLWLWDVDEPGTEEALALEDCLRERKLLEAVVPSKRGLHLVCRPFNVDAWYVMPAGMRRGYGYTIQLHKDNPVNLYIPDGAV